MSVTALSIIAHISFFSGDRGLNPKCSQNTPTSAGSSVNANTPCGMTCLTLTLFWLPQNGNSLNHAHGKKQCGEPIAVASQRGWRLDYEHCFAEHTAMNTTPEAFRDSTLTTVPCPAYTSSITRGIGWIISRLADGLRHQTEAPMGDKSPKSKNRDQKHKDTAKAGRAAAIQSKQASQSRVPQTTAKGKK
jgi:hypothetical protein